MGFVGHPSHYLGLGPMPVLKVQSCNVRLYSVSKYVLWKHQQHCDTPMPDASVFLSHENRGLSSGAEESWRMLIA